MGKAVMFMAFVWFFVIIAGNVMQGTQDFVRTHLTTAMTATDDHMHVASTVGYPDQGILVIENEHIGYSVKNQTTLQFYGNVAQPFVRGAEGTIAAVHASGKQVTTVPGAMVNSSASYNIAVMSDSSGMMAFVSSPLAFFALLGGFMFLPLSFLGTDLQILTFLWAIIGIGILASLTVSMAGGRRV